MDAFEYLSALTAVIVGLTIVHTMEGLGRIISDPSRYRLYWIHFLWAVWLLFYCAFFWWFEFALVKIEVWTFGHFTQVLMYASTLYYIAVVLFPRSAHFDGDFKTHYYNRRGWLMAGFFAANVIDIFDTLAKGQVHFDQLGLEYKLIIGFHLVIALLAWRFRQPWLHGAAIVLILGWQVRITLSLFGTLA